MPDAVWFWQRMVTPHMMGLAKAVAARGCAVTYVAETLEDPARARQGWEVPDTTGVELKIVSGAEDAAKLVRLAPRGSVHLCQGLRGNGVVATVQRQLAESGLTQWAMLETVDDSGVSGAVKRLCYGLLVRRAARVQQGLLAIGGTTASWLCARGMPPRQVYPFAYFLERGGAADPAAPEPGAPFRFVFVGQFIERKRLELLIAALAEIERDGLELVVIGTGPDEASLEALARQRLGHAVRWIGKLPQGQVPAYLAGADCLVLPSRHDGWGAVVSEAMMAGTPAICSDSCGAAAVVRASGRGGVFESGDKAALIARLREARDAGPVTGEQRADLSRWARCIGSEAGADYLLDILASHHNQLRRPSPPWQAEGGQ